MSIQEMKSRIHLLVDEIQNEAILAEVNRILTGGEKTNIVDELTVEDLTKLEKAREEAQNGQGTSLDAFKRKMEDKWPQLKSL